ncbi:HemK methyltransferase member 1 [Perkinsus chesapeaki]|uniref:peptide chain release factor N(5)-glutamine methyltransferase n=1 Tax=Perkinsus chesapeaki TaxID=330153 RepID=A0A7J6MK97_PERCH|nr:HemK methyltransferase member 1 [Perkinsus chesapeaki]
MPRCCGSRMQMWSVGYRRPGGRAAGGRLFPYSTGERFLFVNRYTEGPREDIIEEERACLRWLRESIKDRRQLREAVRSRALRWTPYQYLVGYVDFLHLKGLNVRAPTLIPRPETEEMVEYILDSSQPVAGRHVLDLCSGSGVIAVALATKWAGCRVDLVDVSEQAMELARENAHLFGVESRLSFLIGAIADQELSEESYDMVVSNPPYIPHNIVESLSRTVKDHEDLLALDGGVDGMDVIQQVIDVSSKVLKPGGLLWMELNAETGQHEVVDSYIKQKDSSSSSLRMQLVKVVDDFRSVPRFVVLRKEGSGALV